MEGNSSTKKVKIALVGESGKMGKALIDVMSEDPMVVHSTDAPDVVIDFSSPEGALKAIRMGKPLVCGTTGLSKEIFEEMHRLAQDVPVLYSPNFSLGVALFFDLLERMGKRLKQFAHVHIEETHHTEKKDSPSGTALRLCELLEGSPNEIVSHRIKGAVAENKVDFEFENETLSIQHTAHSRETFARGAIRAAKFLFNKPAKLYALAELFD